MMSVSEFFSSDPEPPWIVDIATDSDSFTDIHTQIGEAASTSTSEASSSFIGNGSNGIMEMEVDGPAAAAAGASGSSQMDRVIAHLFTLREIESVRPFRIDDFKSSPAGGIGFGTGRRAVSRSKPSRKRKFAELWALIRASKMNRAMSLRIGSKDEKSVKRAFTHLVEFQGNIDSLRSFPNYLLVVIDS
ncbi:hypothetical protein R1sor_006787 [Riccia sorocarpa]|uniref:Uncharacterized protein n=1 Tax=Riccia sorocarpa TaxID=122646 RepID=A0ABD3HQC5_9MARC